MSENEEWAALLQNHPIFDLPKAYDVATKFHKSLELSTNTLPNFTKEAPDEGTLTPAGRRQVMILKDADLIVAVGKEIRISSFGDLKLSRSIRRSYKTLHTPNIQFEIHQIALNPSGKLLAVAGAYQTAVIVLPRPGYSRLVPSRLDCKAIQIGQFYHATPHSAPLAKIEWHPWGEAASTLLVMTIDGKLREYDISTDTEEPQQVLTFVPEKKPGSFVGVDSSEREVASFTLGKGRADWGPLTIYALLKSGDIYSICPYMPQNASIPSAYIHSLECFISAKQEFLLQGTSSASKSVSAIYDYQHKYVAALIKQLPPGTVFPAISKPVHMHPPTTIKPLPLRQGPFLLQPAPRILTDSEGGDATDIAYLAFGTESYDRDNEVSDPEHLGVILVSYQDGRVDLFLDVEKVEARWETKQTAHNELPMLAVYETIDLGLIKALKELAPTKGSPSPTQLLQGNHPVILLDPLHDDFAYVYHAFGLHALDISPVLQSLAAALREENDEGNSLKEVLEKATMANVRPMLNTFSVEKKNSNPVIAVAIPNDVYLNYCIFILTSAMRVTTFPLDLRSEADPPPKKLAASTSHPTPSNKSKWLTPVEGIESYKSILEEPYNPIFPTPKNPKLSLPTPSFGSKEFMLTPDTLRFLGNTVAEVGSEAADLQMLYRTGYSRIGLQKIELKKQAAACREIDQVVEELKGPIRKATDERLARVHNEQRDLLARLDRLLQALMREASPELSEHESKWFAELKRMKDDILGRGKYDEDSLVSRTRLLEKEYARILPPLKALVEKEKERSKRHTETTQNLGFSQAFEYGQRSTTDRVHITAIEKQVHNLAAKLDVALGPSPGSSTQT
ncbi:hypothetical protein HYPSUDRAFT_32154 [Hypholoma sublateritium FD-334 SS-4]|uniref:Uncharacterized protein n=1 Tax=Hypholoma sublateritium (strain FD-334 SS-4) TaxID=945553 RepID=A0A0D2QER8_HYPSF|nr:hypothetical protein HYPSUDRAFT_32154 [Hypholoma sublateritium FD-334 SS-4]